MTYQEQYDIFDWLFSSIDELIDCDYLTNTMEDKTEQKCLKEKPSCTETIQGKEGEKKNDKLRKDKVLEF